MSQLTDALFRVQTIVKKIQANQDFADRKDIRTSFLSAVKEYRKFAKTPEQEEALLAIVNPILHLKISNGREKHLGTTLNSFQALYELGEVTKKIVRNPSLEPDARKLFIKTQQKCRRAGVDPRRILETVSPILELDIPTGRESE